MNTTEITVGDLNTEEFIGRQIPREAVDEEHLATLKAPVRPPERKRPPPGRGGGRSRGGGGGGGSRARGGGGGRRGR